MKESCNHLSVVTAFIQNNTKQIMCTETAACEIMNSPQNIP